MIPAGFEPATVRLEGECSIQLSYERDISKVGGERGIRTLDSSLFKTIPVFKTGAINHSAISPKDYFYFIPPNRTWL